VPGSRGEMNMGLDNTFFLLFFAALLFALAGCACWYLVALRLLKLGLRVSFFATARDTLSMFREYRQAASTSGWSQWPPVVFWFCVAGMFLFGIASALSTSAPSGAGSVARLVNPDVLLVWVALSSLGLALLSSYRAFSDSSKGRSGTKSLSHLSADHLARRNLYLVALAWLGFFVSAIVLAVGRFSR
jgi:hypothetical protein